MQLIFDSLNVAEEQLAKKKFYEALKLVYQLQIIYAKKLLLPLE